MTARTRHQCAGQIYTGSYSQPYRPCERSATVEEAGKWYCASHAPSRVIQRQQASMERHEAKSAQWRDEHNRRMAEQRACRGISTEALEAGAIAELVAAAKAVVSAGSWELSYALQLSEPPISDLRAALAKLEVQP